MATVCCMFMIVKSCHFKGIALLICFGQIKEDETWGVHSTRSRDEKYMRGFDWKT
jgi:hypothetical protein